MRAGMQAPLLHQEVHLRLKVWMLSVQYMVNVVSYIELFICSVLHLFTEIMLYKMHSGRGKPQNFDRRPEEKIRLCILASRQLPYIRGCKLQAPQ